MFQLSLLVAAIETFQYQLKESLIAASDTLVSQTRDQSRAIKEEAYATTLPPRLLLVETLL